MIGDMLEQRIQQHFIDSADLNYQAAQNMSQPIEAAVQAMLACVTGGGKVLACGNGASAAEAMRLAALCIMGLERERPELAAIALTSNGGLLTAASPTAENTQQFARQVRALGQAGDVLVIITTSGNTPNLIAAIEAAHERDMTVVALTGRMGGLLASQLQEIDVHIAVPHDRLTRVHEMHTLVVHCLCDGIDAQLLGEQELSE